MTDERTADDRWRRVNEILLEALERDGAEREAFLARACGGDEELRAEVVSLLEVDDEALDRLDRPAVDLTGRPFHDPRTGRFIGPYQLLDELGQGGMGKVYLAVHRDDTAGRRVALKVLKRGLDSKNLLHRFEREREILSRLDHPAVVHLLDAGTSDDRRPYLVMEHVGGEPVDSYCDRHRLSIRQRLELFLKVCDAVAFAHGNLVIHRDLKPTNILVEASGTPRLLDFGIAKILEPETLTPVSVTSTGMRMMTPEYASPEQALGEPVTPQSDVYALGVLLYELLTGERPYSIRGRDEEEIRREIRDTDPERPSRAVTAAVDPEAVSRAREENPSGLRRQLRGDLDHIVMTALRKEPRHRYASAAALSGDIRRHFAARPVRARVRVFAYRAGVMLRQSARWAALVAFAGAVAGVLWSSLGPRSESRDATRGTPRGTFDKSAERIERELADRPGLQAQAMLTLGRVHRSQGRYDQAVALLERALARRRELHGGVLHPDVAEALDELALAHRLRGAVDAAVPFFEEALSIRAELLGDGDPETARSRVRLAAVRLAGGEVAAAAALAERALEVLEVRSPSDEEAVALAQNVLGASLAARGRYAEAEPLLLDSCAVLSRRRSAAEHDVREARQRLVALYEAWGRPEKAAPYRAALSD